MFVDLVHVAVCASASVYACVQINIEYIYRGEGESI